MARGVELVKDPNSNHSYLVNYTAPCGTKWPKVAQIIEFDSCNPLICFNAGITFIGVNMIANIVAEIYLKQAELNNANTDTVAN